MSRKARPRSSKPTVARYRGFCAHRLSYPHALPAVDAWVDATKKKNEKRVNRFLPEGAEGADSIKSRGAAAASAR